MLMILIMSIIIIVTTANVVARYVIKAPIFWSDELNLTLFVWLIFMGIAIAVKDGEHMSIDFFVSFLPEKLQNIIALILRILISATIVFILIGGLYMTRMSAMQSSPSLPVSRMWAFIPIPISCLIMLYYEVKHIIGIVKELFSEGRG